MVGLLQHEELRHRAGRGDDEGHRHGFVRLDHAVEEAETVAGLFEDGALGETVGREGPSGFRHLAEGQAVVEIARRSEALLQLNIVAVPGAPGRIDHDLANGEPRRVCGRNGIPGMRAQAANDQHHALCARDLLDDRDGIAQRSAAEDGPDGEPAFLVAEGQAVHGPWLGADVGGQRQNRKGKKIGESGERPARQWKRHGPVYHCGGQC